MRTANVFVNDELAGHLTEKDDGTYAFYYLPEYKGHPVSLTMPVKRRNFSFEEFPPFFEGLLPEGIQLEGLLRQNKLDRKDYFGQLLAVGEELVGAVNIKKVDE
ncbi:MAG TPA: HipA N-terminal domain-containing protein [Cyclobacteriaceae bacterium]|nr:HipA N-terminal domain-containing protein [Cyclobacteriaceae bacterium]